MATVPRLKDGDDSFKGPIAWMTRNSVTANLLMFVILIGGLINVGRVKQEVFPEFKNDTCNGWKGITKKQSESFSPCNKRRCFTIQKVIGLYKL